MDSKNIGAKFYSKKRLFIAGCIHGVFAGGISAHLYFNDTGFVLSVLTGAIVGLFVNVMIVPKLWLYRLRQALKTIKKTKINLFR